VGCENGKLLFREPLDRPYRFTNIVKLLVDESVTPKPHFTSPFPRNGNSSERLSFPAFSIGNPLKHVIPAISGNPSSFLIECTGDSGQQNK
jgi:hypothetical protein